MAVSLELTDFLIYLCMQNHRLSLRATWSYLWWNHQPRRTGKGRGNHEFI